MMKKIFLTGLMASMLTMAQAEELKLPSWLSNVKLSGYALLQYQYSGLPGDKSNSFNLRLGRVSLDGRIANDFYWKTQIQINGNTSTLGNSPRLVDLFVEWQKYDFFKVKLGQYKTPFTFENPMNPIDQGFMSYAQNISKLAGFSDRAGEHASNGRDIGLQIQGDFLKNASGRALLHYQVGVFNGQGINTKDVDNRKNIIGGVWVMPVKGMRLGVFGWEGSYARKGTWTTVVPNNLGGIQTEEHTGVRSLPQHRYAFSAEYKADDWTFRSEYIHSTGEAFAKTLSNTDDASSTNCELGSNGNKSQGVYALVIAPVVKKKLYLKARYDMYQPTGDTSKMKTFYEVGLNYNISKNLTILSEYALVNDRSLSKHNYSMADVELCFRF